MKLKKITVHNIASIADAEIDFLASPLAGAPLFLITGPTGAGKSIILDAVCLALYAQTPRMSRAGSKEKYEESVVDRGKRDERDVMVNANSQLMRRSTGECYAKLLFEGNDGNDYEAQWQLQRANRRVSGKMQQEKRSLTRLDTGETWAKKADVDEQVQAVVGLRFEQFCRTTLLAQGEFTRFLQSKSDEKSEILERLTGIDIYSAVGRKIADRTKAASDAYDRLKIEVEGIKLLTDEEKAELQASADKQTKLLEELKQQVDEAEKKRKWLADAATYKKRLEEAQQQLAQIREIVGSDDYKGQLQLVDRYDRSATARVHLAQRVKAMEQTEAITSELPNLVKHYNEADAEWHRLSADIAAISKSMEEPTAKLVAIDKQGLTERQKQLYDALGFVKTAAERCKLIATHKEAVTDCKAKIEALSTRIPALRAEQSAATADYNDCRALYAQMEASVGDAARELRRQLAVGAACPVCGRTVERVFPDEHFQSVLEPVRQRLTAAEDRRNKATTNLTVDEREKKRLEAEYAKTQKLLNKASAEAADVEAKAVAACKAVGTREDEESINVALSEVGAKLQAAATLQKECDELRKRYDAANKKLAQAADARQKMQNQLTQRRSELAAARRTAEEQAEALNTFYVDNHDIDEAVLVNLAKEKKNKIDAIRQRCNDVQAESNRREGAVKTTAEMIERHADSRPQLAEGENAETLASAVGQMSADSNRLLQDIALLRGRLNDDKKKGEAFAAAMARTEEARKEWVRWDGLCKLLGDSDGKRFRIVAQSFILSHLLTIANGYLRQFSDRYTLTCQPGSLLILVADTHSAAAPQSANVLSGGESFMVSLSLALALSRLNAADTGVDTLFIDEGFGTLSDECLTNVMDTLEALHQMGGRRVGIISHVDELSSRIQVQVRVERADVTRSEVTVVDTCGYGD